MQLEYVDAHIRARLKDVRGRVFFGSVKINSVLRTQNDIADYLLEINKECFIRAGDAMVWDTGKFLLGTGVTDSLGGPLGRNLRMIRVDRELEWTRAGTTTDPLTGLPRQSYDISEGTILISLQATSKNIDAFKVDTSKYLLVTNSPIQVNDRVGPYIIMFVEQKHVLFYAEAK